MFNVMSEGIEFHFPPQIVPGIVATFAAPAA